MHRRNVMQSYSKQRRKACMQCFAESVANTAHREWLLYSGHICAIDIYVVHISIITPKMLSP